MNDLTDLHDAFAELERRADAHPATALTVRSGAGRADTGRSGAGRPTPTRPAGSRRRPVLIGATAAVLLAGVAGAVAIATDSDPVSRPAATTPAAGSSAPSSASPTASPSARVPVALTTAELEDRFRTALAGRATFTVTQRVEDDRSGPTEVSTAPSASSTGAPLASEGAPSDAPTAPTTESPVGADDHDVLIGGVLTAGGSSGGYDVQTAVGWSGPAFCESDTACTVTTLGDGSSLAVGTTSVLAADGSADGGTTSTVCLVRPDGVFVLFHLGNEQDPKGMSARLADAPPLTTAQMTAIVTSPAWYTP